LKKSDEAAELAENDGVSLVDQLIAAAVAKKVTQVAG
jgi:hypothetical protein